jgi:hypothetical protein
MNKITCKHVGGGVLLPVGSLFVDASTKNRESL